MQPILNAGDSVLAIRLNLRNFLSKGKIVLVNTSTISTNGLILPTYIIKRIHATEGEIVRINISEIDGVNYQSNHLTKDNFLEWEIPPNHIFLRGDNKSSADSIVWGPIHVKACVGIVLFKFPSKSN